MAYRKRGFLPPSFTNPFLKPPPSLSSAWSTEWGAYRNWIRARRGPNKLVKCSSIIPSLVERWIQLRQEVPTPPQNMESASLPELEKARMVSLNKRTVSNCLTPTRTGQRQKERLLRGHSPGHGLLRKCHKLRLCQSLGTYPVCQKIIKAN
jgi:hypothetical protein